MEDPSVASGLTHLAKTWQKQGDVAELKVEICSLKIALGLRPIGEGKVRAPTRLGTPPRAVAEFGTDWA